MTGRLRDMCDVFVRRSAWSVSRIEPILDPAGVDQREEGARKGRMMGTPRTTDTAKGIGGVAGRRRGNRGGRPGNVVAAGLVAVTLLMGVACGAARTIDQSHAVEQPRPAPTDAAPLNADDFREEHRAIPAPGALDAADYREERRAIPTVSALDASDYREDHRPAVDAYVPSVWDFREDHRPAGGAGDADPSRCGTAC